MLLRVRDMRVALPSPDGVVTVLDGVDLDLEPGHVVDITGESGVGKSTLVRAIARLQPHASATMTLREIDSASIVATEWRCRVVLAPQKPAIADGTVRENLLLPWRFKVRKHRPVPGDDELMQALAEVRLDFDLDRDSARLSVGQQARVALVRVLLTRPDVLLLDEPDAALDEESARAVRDVISSFAGSGGGVARVRHRGSDGIATRRLLLSRGALEEVPA